MRWHGMIYGLLGAALLVSARAEIVTKTVEYKEGDTVFVDAENGSIQFWTEEFADKMAKDRKERKQPVGALN